MKTITSIFISLCAVSLMQRTYSQTQMTYNGNFEKGVAKYQYYENNNFDRILDGQFSYSSDLYNYAGNFKENKRDGSWVISSENKKFSDYYITAKFNTKVSGNYNKGKYDGRWSYKNAILRYNEFTGKWAQYEEKESSDATFFENHFIGQISYSSTSPEDIFINKRKVSVTGEFDSNGFLNGEWVFVDGKYKDIIKYDKGIAMYRLLIDNTNGNKYVYCDSTSFIKSFWSNYNAETGVSIVGNVKYYPDTILFTQNIKRVPDYGVLKLNNNEVPEELNNPAIELWQSKSNINEYNPLYYYHAGASAPIAYIVVVKKLELNESNHSNKNLIIYNVLENINQNNLSRYWNEEQISSFSQNGFPLNKLESNLKNKCKINFTDSELNSHSTLLKLCNKYSLKKDEIYNKYQSRVNEINNSKLLEELYLELSRDLNLLINSIIQDNKIIGQKNKIYEFIKSMQAEKSLNNWTNENITEFNKYEEGFSEFKNSFINCRNEDFIRICVDYKKNIDKINAFKSNLYFSESIEDVEAISVNINKLFNEAVNNAITQRKKEYIDKLHKGLIELYKVEIISTSNNTTTYKANKINLFKAYLKVYKETSLSKQDDLIVLQKKMIRISDKNTKSLEKTLKVEKTVNEIYNEIINFQFN